MPSEKTRPKLQNSVPTSHLRIMIDIAAEKGVPAGKLLEGTSLSLEQLEKPDLRVSARNAARFAFNTMLATKNPALGLEFGLRVKLTTHGPVGYAALSCGTLEEALQMVVRFIHLRQQDATIKVFTEDQHVVVLASDNHDLGPARQLFYEAIMVGFLRMSGFLLGEDKPDGELWFDFPEPPYYAAYRDRLPKVRFGMPSIQLRFPAAYLRRPLVLADPVAVRKAVAECEREMALAGRAPENVIERVRAELQRGKDGYPDLEGVATRLHMSTRTLKRKLEGRNTTFVQLLDQARYRDALTLLENPDLDVQRVSSALGFSDPPSFTRAFRRWSGEAPSEVRKRLLGGA